MLAHRISLLSLHAGALELRPDAPADEIARAAGVIRSSAHEALEDLREVIGVLRADRADDGQADEAPERPQPTLVDLPELIDESREAGTRVELECQVTDLGAVPEAVGRKAYRIVQEGLTNARKHAHQAAVSVTVQGAAADGLTVEIRNPWPVGVADTTPIPGAGSGIVGLAERAASPAGGWSTAAPRRVTSGCGPGCRGRRDRSGPGPRRRRRPPRAGRSRDDPRPRARHRHGRGGGRRHRGARRGRRVRTGRGADGHPHAQARRPRRHRTAPRPPRPARGHRADHLPRRRVRAAGPAGRGQRLPAQGHPARRDPARDRRGWRPASRSSRRR